MYNTNDIVLSPLTLTMSGWGYLFGIIYTKCIHTNCHRGVNFGLKNAKIDFFWLKNAGKYAKKRKSRKLIRDGRKKYAKCVKKTTLENPEK